MMIRRWLLPVASGWVLVALAAGPAEAQRGLELGFRGGVSVASASFDADETFSAGNRTGFVGGVFLDWDFGGLGFQVAGQYTQKGVELDLGSAVEELSLKYFEVPAVLKLGIPLEAIKPSVFGGVALGFNTGCESEGEDCQEDIDSAEFSGVAGGDVAIRLGGLTLWVDGRYHFGLNDIGGASDVVGDLKNRNWMLQAGLGFRVGG